MGRETVFNIKPCVFPTDLYNIGHIIEVSGVSRNVSDAALPNCLACVQARHQTPRVSRISIPRTYPRDETINAIPYTQAVLGHVAWGLPGGMVTARIKPCIMSNLTVITLNKFGNGRGVVAYTYL